MKTVEPSQADDDGFPHIGDALPRRGGKVTRWLAQRLMRLFGWRVAGSAPNLPKMVLIGAPHTSNLDFILTIATMSAMGIQLSWVAKHSLFRWPYGGFFRWLGGIGVNRKSTKGFVGKLAQEYQQREKLLLAIMPEGTRSKVKRWRTGFYYLALQAQVPILLVTFDYGNKVMRIGPALQPSGDIDADLPQIQARFAGVQPRHPDRDSSQ